MNTNDISVKQKSLRQRLLRKAAMLFVALICCFFVTTSGTWLTAKGVVAVGGVPVIVTLSRRKISRMPKTKGMRQEPKQKERRIPYPSFRIKNRISRVNLQNLIRQMKPKEHSMRSYIPS